jgi:phosphate:Na+ symporter
MILIILSLTIVGATDPYGEDVSGEGRIVLSGSSLKIAIQVLDEGKPVSDKWVHFKAKNGILSSDSVLSDQLGYACTEFIPDEDGYVICTVNSESIEINPFVIQRDTIIKLILSVIIGSVLILMGLDSSNKGFSRLSGEKIKQTLWKMTNRPIFAYLTGIFLAIFLESSTLTGLMLLGLLESSLINLSTSLIVLAGASLGSTLTVQIIATDIIRFSPIFVLVGFLLWQSKTRWNYIGRILLGFGLIFFSIWLIRESIKPFIGIFTLQINPFIIFLSSIILTFIFHSSAATLGLIIGFTGILNLYSVIPIILGANIGTTFTILLGSTQTSSEGKAMGLGYVILRTLFVILSLVLLFLPKALIPTSREIANIHTFVNMWGFALIPFIFPLAFSMSRLFKRKLFGVKLDTIYLSTPSIAISKCHEAIRESMDILINIFKATLVVFKRNNNALRKVVTRRDDEIDKIQEELTSYSSRLLGHELTERESNKCVTILKIMNEIEHIGDLISKSLMAYAEKKIKDAYFFSEEGFKEIQDYHYFVLSNIEIIQAAIGTMDKDLAREILKKQDESKDKLDRFRESHLSRLKSGKPESIDTSTIHLDILNDLDRINLHIYNIARAIIGKL